MNVDSPFLFFLAASPIALNIGLVIWLLKFF